MATRKSSSTTDQDEATPAKVPDPQVSTAPKETPSGESGPTDETDPAKRVTSVNVVPNAEALAAGTVDAVAQLPTAGPAETPPERVEQYDAVKPDGSTVTVIHDLNTGETRIK